MSIEVGRFLFFESFNFFVVFEVIDGKIYIVIVVELNLWVEYEFRIVVSNKIGGGEFSLFLEKVRIEEVG